MFKSCEVCGSEMWAVVYAGHVRDGAFGRLTAPEARVGRCGTCGVERLAEPFCRPSDIYESAKYRSLLEEPTDAAGFFAEHDSVQLQNLSVLWPLSARGKVVADVGCAAGSFLDHVRGLTADTIAVEPCQDYHPMLRERGHKVYARTEDAVRAEAGRVDMAYSFSVIEHVGNPRVFLSEIADLLASDGKLLVSTPNRRDALMDLLPSDYPAFFYRSVHRWYFDADSLSRCATAAGLRVIETLCVHRFGLSNAMTWLRDRRPGGHAALPHIQSPMLDRLWQTHLEQAGVGDYLYVWLERAG